MSTSSNTLLLDHGSREDSSTNMASGEEERSVNADEEDDYAGYFLEPTAGGAANIAEKVAEANRKLYEDDPSEGEEARPTKVQFSEKLVQYEPENYDSDDLESDGTGTVSEEEMEKTDVYCVEEPESDKMDGPQTGNPESTIAKEDSDGGSEQTEDGKSSCCGEVPEELEGNPQPMKVLLVMLPREQSSSCESVIGEEIPGEEVSNGNRSGDGETSDVSGKAGCCAAPAVTPQQPNRGRTPNPCKVSKITPDLNYSRKEDGKKWYESRKPGLRCKKPKTKASVEDDDASKKKDPTRPKSSIDENRIEEAAAAIRPKTAPDRRTCCAAKTGLPRYNGLRSEYGLSAEQLQERKRKTFELRQQKRTERLKKRQEETRRKVENEESFSQWLDSKRRSTSAKRGTATDTLARSDVYIQNHAVYAARRGVPYSVDLCLSRKKAPRMLLLDRNREKTICLERLFEDAPPRVSRTYSVYLGEDFRK